MADPHAPGSAADIELSVKTLLRVRDNISQASDIVNQIEWLRKQLEVIETMLRPPKKKERDGETSRFRDEDDEGEEPAPAPAEIRDEAQTKRKAELLKASADLDQKLQAIEYRLASPALLDSDDKYFVEPYKVYLDLIWLNAEVGTGGGDVAGGADFAPTDTELELLKTFETEMAAVDADYQNVLKADLPALNRSLTDNKLVPLVAPSSPGQSN